MKGGRLVRKEKRPTRYTNNEVQTSERSNDITEHCMNESFTKVHTEDLGGRAESPETGQ